jgi:NADH:ubiquinone oxidoreductase subunit 3 (subunit A)
MLLFKRLLTSFVLFLILGVALSIGTLAVVGGVVGARAAADTNARDYQSGYAAGHAAGQEVGRKYGGTIILIALGVSAVTSVVIPFTGILPWCRKKSQPPPLPQV